MDLLTALHCFKQRASSKELQVSRLILLRIYLLRTTLRMELPQPAHTSKEERLRNNCPAMAARHILPCIIYMSGSNLCFDRRNPSVLRHTGRLQLCDWPWHIYLLGSPLNVKRWTQTKESSTKSRFLLIHRLYANASNTQNKKSHGTLVPRIRRIAPFGTHFVSGTFFTYRIHTLWLWEMNILSSTASHGDSPLRSALTFAPGHAPHCSDTRHGGFRKFLSNEQCFIHLHSASK